MQAGAVQIRLVADIMDLQSKMQKQDILDCCTATEYVHTWSAEEVFAYLLGIYIFADFAFLTILCIYFIHVHILKFS